MRKQTSNYHKLIFFTRTELKGTYNFNDIFQIYPIKGDGFPFCQIQKHFPNYIELKTSQEDNINIQTPYPEMDEIISGFAPSINKQDLILNLLTTCSNHLFFKYDYPNEMWAIPIQSPNPDDYLVTESMWSYPVYISNYMTENNNIIKYSDLSKLDNIEIVKCRDYFLKNVDQDKDYSGPVKFPYFLDDYLICFFNLENDLKQNVNQAMYHLKNGIELAESKKSLSLLSLFTALETMVNLEYRGLKVEHCELCNQKVFQISRKFKEFLSKYVSNHPDSKSKFNKLYSLRSKIVHSGEILKSEFIYSEAKQETKKEENLKIIEIIQFCRLAIVNWVIHHQLRKQIAHIIKT